MSLNTYSNKFFFNLRIISKNMYFSRLFFETNEFFLSYQKLRRAFQNQFALIL